MRGRGDMPSAAGTERFAGLDDRLPFPARDLVLVTVAARTRAPHGFRPFRSPIFRGWRGTGASRASFLISSSQSSGSKARASRRGPSARARSGATPVRRRVPGTLSRSGATSRSPDASPRDDRQPRRAGSRSAFQRLHLHRPRPCATSTASSSNRQSLSTRAHVCRLNPRQNPKPPPKPPTQQARDRSEPPESRRSGAPPSPDPFERLTAAFPGAPAGQSSPLRKSSDTNGGKFLSGRRSSDEPQDFGPGAGVYTARLVAGYWVVDV